MTRNKTLLLGLSMLISVACQQKQPADERFSVYETTGTMTEELSFNNKGGEKALQLFSGREWNSTVSASWLTITPDHGLSGKSSIRIKVEPNEGKTARAADISFQSAGTDLHHIKVEQSGTEEKLPDEPSLPKAEILDVVFNEDGTAANASDTYGLKVTGFPDMSLMNYHNDLWDKTVAHFNHAAGKNTAEGFYKADYTGNSKVTDALQDGHSMEIVFSTSFRPDGKDELKMFSSHEQGGTGFLISRSNQGSCITFLPNVSTTGKSNWIWTKSGIVPEPGQYYHVIGVWDKAAGKSYIYVDGKLSGTANASGSLVLPKSGCHWFGIGADASTSGGQGAWAGDIVYAKVYDQVLSADEVKAIYEHEKCTAATRSVTLENVQYLANCRLAAGNSYNIYADGFKSGDQIILTSAQNPGTRFECETSIKDWGASAIVPAQLTSGDYQLFAVRNGSQIPIGPVHVKMTSGEDIALQTRCVAHRCYHENGSKDQQYPENSVAAFKRTQDLGVWGAEIDVWITRDDEVVVNHNSTVPTDPQAHVLENSYSSELKDIRLANGEKLPTLTDFLLQMKAKPGLKLVLEIKSHSTPQDNARVVDKCIDLVKAASLEKEVIWIAFNYDNCTRIAKALPEATVQYLGGDKSPSVCKTNGINGIDYEGGRLKDSWILDAHDRGMSVNVWTINDQASMLKFMTKGVDFITTDHPDVLQELLSRTFVTRN